MSRLLIVSNRLPITVKLQHGDVVITPSSGGLATGLSGPHLQNDSLWIGWPGDITRFDTDHRAQIEIELLALRTIPLHLTPTEITRYYEGFSNGVLWPLFHYLTDKVQRDAWKNWTTYVDVNESFAGLVAKHYRPGDMVWVHDYQLSLVPRFLRQRLPEARIGYFLHIPFPSSEVFRILPWRTQFLEGILGADLIGFHTYSYARHFSRALLHVLGVEEEAGRLHYDGREIRVGVFPMGIDAEHFSNLAEQSEVASECQATRAKMGDRKLLLGVDRLDYTKGLARRMLAVERLLEREPSLRRKIRLIQVVVPSRTKVESYENLRRQLDEIVGRVNGAYGTVNSVPIHYLYRSVTEQQLVSLYRAADVMLVTPLRDGMNLVAKEFVASRNDEDGVLVLSEFAGAAAELGEALIVNPYDIDRVASTIKDALTMPVDERRARMNALRRRVQTYDSNYWVRRFVSELGSCGQGAENRRSLSSEDEIQGLIERLRKSERLLLLLDYDGTLIPFAGAPELAAPDSELKRLLSNLARRPQTSVHLLSGRRRENLERWMGNLQIGLHAEHGFWSRTPKGSWEPLTTDHVEWKATLLPLMRQFTAATPGSLVEEKTTGLAWHYRMADRDFGELHARELWSRLEKELVGLPADLLQGDKVIEVRARGVHKGIIASRLVSGEGEEAGILAMGDDYTDEDLFAALPQGSFSVHVGPRPSIAQYRLPDPAAARSFLTKLINNNG
jgi:trehalose 6-phosphate synthase/phosphatase